MLVEIAIWLLSGYLLVTLAPLIERLGVPAVIVAVVAGMMMGPLWLDIVSYDITKEAIADAAVVLILFSVGYEIQWSRFLPNIGPGLVVGIAGILTSGMLGYLSGFSISNRVDEALYIAVALSATSIAISVPLLSREGLLASKLGQILLSAAIIDDILALYLLSMIHVGLTSSGVYGEIIRQLIIGLVALLALTLTIRVAGALLIELPPLSDRRVRRISVVILVLAAALVGHWAGISGAVGGFFAGAALSTVDNEFRLKDQEYFRKLGSMVAPLFFLTIGIQMDDLGAFDLELFILTVAVTISAIIGKLFAPWFIRTQLDSKERWVLGLALTPRGEVGLIVAGIGLAQNHLSHHAMVALLSMTLVTTLLPALLLPRLRS